MNADLCPHCGAELPAYFGGDTGLPSCPACKAVLGYGFKGHETTNEIVADLCPHCGADRDGLRVMLGEPPVLEHIETTIGGRDALLEAEDHALARAILNSCPACMAGLGHLLKLQEGG